MNQSWRQKQAPCCLRQGVMVLGAVGAIALPGLAIAPGVMAEPAAVKTRAMVSDRSARALNRVSTSGMTVQEETPVDVKGEANGEAQADPSELERVGSVAAGLTRTESPRRGLAGPSTGLSDRLILTYGPLRLPLPLDDLESFSHSGQLSPQLLPYTASLNPAVTQQLRHNLRQKLGLAPPQLSQLLHSPLGELLLSLPENLVHGGEHHQPHLLRRAMLSAAETSEGLSLVNVLRQLPQDTAIDLKTLTELWRQRQQLEQRTQQRLQQLHRESQAIAAAEREPFSKADWAKVSADKTDLRQPGAVPFTQQALHLHDAERDRNFQADLYLPDSNVARSRRSPQPLSQPAPPEATLPLVIISHGLGANREGHAFFARHLASHGIAAAVLQHPGSDTEQMRAMLQGERQEAVETSAFIERPRDVSYLLDVLEQRGPDFGVQLRLDRVGVYGHSFGAYTALALAGAPLNFQQLDRDCNPEAFATDLSLILQCRAQALPRRNYQLRDERVAALLLFDPVSRSIFGAQGLSQIKLPVFWGGSDADFLTPLVTQQLPAFEKLASADKYLGIVEAVPHMNVQFEQLAATEDLAQSNLIHAKPEAFQAYVNALGLAFVQVHVADRPNYRAYLTASYGAALSEAPHELRFLPYSRR